jgi:hypothetical protein
MTIHPARATAPARPLQHRGFTMPSGEFREYFSASTQLFRITFDAGQNSWSLQKAVTDGTFKVLALYTTQAAAIEDCTRLCSNSAQLRQISAFAVYDTSGRFVFARRYQCDDAAS